MNKLLLIFIVIGNICSGQQVNDELIKHPDYYVYNDARDTLYLTKIDVGHFFSVKKSTVIFDSIQIDGTGPKEVVFYRVYSGSYNDIKQAYQSEEKTVLSKYEVWNIETKMLLFEAVNSYQFESDTWHIEFGNERIMCSYHYNFTIDSVGTITILNFLELMNEGNCNVDKSMGIYNYKNGQYIFYSKDQVMKNDPVLYINEIVKLIDQEVLDTMTLTNQNLNFDTISKPFSPVDYMYFKDTIIQIYHDNYQIKKIETGGTTYYFNNGELIKTYFSCSSVAFMGLCNGLFSQYSNYFVAGNLDTTITDEFLLTDEFPGTGGQCPCGPNVILSMSSIHNLFVQFHKTLLDQNPQLYSTKTELSDGTLYDLGNTRFKYFKSCSSTHRTVDLIVKGKPMLIKKYGEYGLYYVVPEELIDGYYDSSSSNQIFIYGKRELIDQSNTFFLNLSCHTTQTTAVPHLICRLYYYVKHSVYSEQMELEFCGYEFMSLEESEELTESLIFGDFTRNDIEKKIIRWKKKHP